MTHALKFVIITVLCLPAPTAAQRPVEVAPNAPRDRPLTVAECQWRAALKAMEPHIVQARRTYPAARARFEAGLPPRYTMFVTTRLRDDQGREEQVFVVVDTIQANRIAGRIWNDIHLVSGYRRGQRYVMTDSSLVDWMIARPDGSEEGDSVGKFLDTYRPPAECGGAA